MIIINLTGGLGNQMFQYAFGRYLSISNKTDLKYHYTNALLNTQRHLALDVFNIQAKEATGEDLKNFGIVQNRYINRILYLLDERYRIQLNKRIITQHIPYTYEEYLQKTPDNRYIQGFFTDVRYFKGIEEVLKKEFIPVKPLDAKNGAIAAAMQKENSVSIHVRRGDYITNKANAQSIGFIGIEYYIKSIDEIKTKVANPVFYVFSDDIEWCKTYLSPLAKNMKFVNHNSGKDSYKDLLLMSACKHSIIANSTFSWWGRWLGQH